MSEGNVQREMSRENVLDPLQTCPNWGKGTPTAPAIQQTERNK